MMPDYSYFAVQTVIQSHKLINESRELVREAREKVLQSRSLVARYRADNDNIRRCLNDMRMGLDG